MYGFTLIYIYILILGIYLGGLRQKSFQNFNFRMTFEYENVKTKHHFHPQKRDFQDPGPPGAYHRTIAMAGAKFSSPKWLHSGAVPVFLGGILTVLPKKVKRRRTREIDGSWKMIFMFMFKWTFQYSPKISAWKMI